ncbi:MAG: type VI secretion system protein TssA [Planctomycetota bacterium]
MDLDAIRSLGTTPVPGGEPAGASVRYEPEFDQVSQEIEKLTSVEQTAVDWRRVVELSSGLLRDKGKDLLLGSYLTCALLDQKGYQGLAAGVAVLNGLVDTFWEGLFPELRRLRARIAALEWLAARLEKVLTARGDPYENDRDPLDAAIEGLQRLLSDPDNRFGGDAPNLAPAIRALKDKRSTIPEPEPEPQPEPERPPESEATPVAEASVQAAAQATVEAPPPPPPPEPEPEPDNPETVAAALREMRERQRAFAAILRGADAADPRGYTLLREALWSDLTAAALPEARIGDGEALEPLDKDLEEGEYERVLERTEALTVEFPLWLDVQLCAVRALEGLGRRYARARGALLASLSFLLQRFPALATDKNGSGRAHASQAARVWLANEVLGDGDEQQSGPAKVGADARKLVARGDLGAAMRLLVQNIEGTASRRGRFVLRLDLAELCIEAGRLELAVPQLEQLEQEVAHFSLEEWEPDLATSVVRSLWRCCAGPDAVPSLQARSKDIYARLCRLDPAAAVSAIGPKGD